MSGYLNHWLQDCKEYHPKKISVYIASPYTLPEGDQEKNVAKSIIAFNNLHIAGFIPFAPLVIGYGIDKFVNFSYTDYMEMDFYWLSKCDCLLRLKGESKGADMEVEYAKEIGIPVFYSIEELKKYYGV